MTVPPRATMVAIDVDPELDGAELVPPLIVRVFPDPHEVVPLVPSSDAITASIPSTEDCVSFCPDIFMLPFNIFVIPTVPIVTLVKFPKPLFIVTAAAIPIIECKSKVVSAAMLLIVVLPVIYVREGKLIAVRLEKVEGAKFPLTTLRFGKLKVVIPDILLGVKAPLT